MTKQLFDEDGNAVEVPGDEELAELKEKAEKAAELEETLAEKEEELKKLSDKDFNFKKFRESEIGKRDEILKDATEKEKTLINEIEEVHKRQEEHEQRYFSEAKEGALAALAGDDKELRNKLEDAVKDSSAFLGQPDNSSDLVKRYERAFLYLQGESKKVNPINAFNPATGEYKEPNSKTSFTETAEGEAMFNEKFAKEIAKAKKVNPNL